MVEKELLWRVIIPRVFTPSTTSCDGIHIPFTTYVKLRQLGGLFGDCDISKITNYGAEIYSSGNDRLTNNFLREGKICEFILYLYSRHRKV